MTSSTDPGNKSTDEIQRELEEERQRLRQTSRSLQDRLSIGTVIDEVLNRTRERGPDYAGSLGRTIRYNPIPVALIGISLMWLMAGGQRASEERFRRGHGDGRALDLDEEGGYPRPAPPSGGPPEPLEKRPSSTAPYAPPPPSPLAGEMDIARSPHQKQPVDKDTEKEEPLTLGEDARSGDVRSTTPPPASRPLEEPGSRPSWQRDDEEKP